MGTAAALVLWAVILTVVAAHPLDPLTVDEIAAAVAILAANGDADAATRFASIDLDEPEKAAVLAWRPGQPVARRALVRARRGRTVYAGVVDLQNRRVESWQAIRGVQSRILAEEWRSARHVTTADQGWQAAMRRRGYDRSRLKDISCAPLPAGYLGEAAERGRRLLKVICFDVTRGSNVWARPIEGLVAVVDVDARRVIHMIDTGPVPVSRDPGDLGTPAEPAPPTNRHAAADITLDGHRVQWRNWSFHYRMDPRAGLVLSLLRFADRGRERLILYRGSLAEMFVPYMDRDPAWSFRSYLDVGEWGFGLLSMPLHPGSDCPDDAIFLDATLADAVGMPDERRGVICLFERHTAAPLWRHAEIVNGDHHGRLAVELVMRTIASLGDYDYVIDWVLTEAGEIRIDAGATGIDQVKGVRARTMADATARRDTAYGTLLAPNLVGVNHDHFLSFRLDLDIDGEGNTLVRRRLIPQRLTGGERRSVWRVVDAPVATEGPLAAGGYDGATVWRIENPNVTNGLGQHPAYDLEGDTAISLLAADDFPQRRAAFSAVPLWVTRYDRCELYAAGQYPNQSRGGDGLPAYTSHRRSVANADIVLWWTLGFHHVPRLEDWPVMATAWHSLVLSPDGFFDRNPALEPARAAKPAATGSP
jgi:primary-amine oxidase